MNMFKKNGGFTLVELIVVIAILAILAGVAVPAYSGYIAKAEEASVMQTLSAVNTAAQGLAVAENVAVEEIEVTDAGVITVTTSDDSDSTITQEDVEELTGELSFDVEFGVATWTDDTAKWELNEATTDSSVTQDPAGT